MANAQSHPLLYEHICADPMNADFAAQGWPPVYSASASSRIIIVGQAPGRIAQETGVPWNDASGRLLRQWLGVSDEQFYNGFLLPRQGRTRRFAATQGVCQEMAPKTPCPDASSAPNDSGRCLCAEVLSCPPGREKFNGNGGAICAVFARVFPTGASIAADCSLASA